MEQIFFEKSISTKLELIDEKIFIKDDELYVIYCDIGRESHGFIIIRKDGIVYTINLYGGVIGVIAVENDVHNFYESWQLLLNSKNFDRNINPLYDDLVNINFRIITGIDGIYPPYYLENIRISKIGIKDGIENTIITNMIDYVSDKIYPYFEDREESTRITHLVRDMIKFNGSNMILAYFLKRFLYDCTFWYLFSKDGIDSIDVDNIYEDEDYLSKIFCLDAPVFFDAASDIESETVDENIVISNEELYTVECNLGKESHAFFILVTDDIVHTINLYGGIIGTVSVENSLKDFTEYWKIFINSRDYPENIVNDNFEKMTGIRGMYPPYYLRAIYIYRIKLTEDISNKIIHSIINYITNEVYPVFEDRNESVNITKLIKEMRLFT